MCGYFSWIWVGIYNFSILDDNSDLLLYAAATWQSLAKFWFKKVGNVWTSIIFFNWFIEFHLFIPSLAYFYSFFSLSLCLFLIYMLLILIPCQDSCQYMFSSRVWLSEHAILGCICKLLQRAYFPLGSSTVFCEQQFRPSTFRQRSWCKIYFSSRSSVCSCVLYVCFQ